MFCNTKVSIFDNQGQLKTSQTSYFLHLGYFWGAFCIPNGLFFAIWDVFLLRMYPKVVFLKIWGAFEGLFVSQMTCFSWFGMYFCSECIPNLLFQRFGVLLRGCLYPKWPVFRDLGCMGLLVSQNRKNYMIYDIFKAFLYHKMREIEAFMIFFPAFVS